MSQIPDIYQYPDLLLSAGERFSEIDSDCFSEGRSHSMYQNVFDDARFRARLHTCPNW